MPDDISPSAFARQRQLTRVGELRLEGFDSLQAHAGHWNRNMKGTFMIKKKILASVAAVFTVLGISLVGATVTAAPASALRINQCTTDAGGWGYATLCRTSTYGFSLTVKDTLTDGYCVTGYLNSNTATSCGNAVQTYTSDTGSNLFYNSVYHARSNSTGTAAVQPFRAVTVGANQGCGAGCSGNAYYIP